MSDAPKILVIDDETAILDTLRILLKREGFDVRTAVGGREGLERLAEVRPDVVLSDVRMPGVGGLEVLLAAREADPTLPVILMTAQASLQTAIRAVNEGAFYYIQKPFANDELVAICRRAAESRQLKVENQALKSEIRRRDRSDPVRPIGKARRFLDVLRMADTVAPSDSTVLISGESGTGKEVLARYIHERSDRADGPFVSINCGALPENLLESELFGHVKGSFTGAVRDKQGLFVAAKGGTFFLDEVGEMSPAIQVKLLRALQEREVIPVGATETLPIDVRIIAATNRDLEEEIRRGGFRSDLYYRLNVITLHAAPPCASGPRTSPSWPSTSCSASRRRGGASPCSCRRTRWPCSRGTTGRGTCASWRTPWSGPWCSPATARSPPRRSRRASPSGRRSRWWPTSSRPTRRWRSSSGRTSSGCCSRRAGTSRAPRRCWGSILPRCTGS